MIPKQHSARDGRRVLRFAGTALGSVTSRRGYAPRWSELAVYGLSNGSYIRSKVGRSTVVHSPDCGRVNHWMTAWIDLDDRAESAASRTPCIECQPNLNDGMDPHLMVEATRYTATLAQNAEQLLDLLLEGKPGWPQLQLATAPDLIRDLIRQVSGADPALAALLLVRYRDAEAMGNRPLNH